MRIAKRAHRPFRRCVGGRDVASTVDEPAQSILTIRNADHNKGGSRGAGGQRI